MDLIQKVKDIGIKFTYYVGGRAYDNSKTKRTSAFDDIMKKGKDNGADKSKLEGTGGVGETDNSDAQK
jgi:hypothetical protein